MKDSKLAGGSRRRVWAVLLSSRPLDVLALGNLEFFIRTLGHQQDSQSMLRFDIRFRLPPDIAHFITMSLQYEL